MKVERYGSKGLAYDGDGAVLSFEILAATDQTTIEEEKQKYQQLFRYGDSFVFGDYTIATYGEYNNLPAEVRDLVKNNHLLPELLKKQTRFMYGQGPFLFIEEETEEGIKRKPVSKQYPQVFTWLDNWKTNGLPQSFAEYAKLTIMEYYYMEGQFTKYIYNRSRRINGDMPVRGLVHISSTEARLAMRGLLETTLTIEDEMLDTVLVGRWDLPFRYNIEAFPRFDAANPLANATAINYTGDRGFGESIYSFPTFYYGLKEWITGSNLNPKYINSYLKNSLNAKLHVVIPAAWIEARTRILEQITTENQTREQQGKPLQTQYEGLKDIGTVFNYSMVNKLIDIKLQQLTQVLSGAGENQGKTFFTQSFKTEHGIEKWEFIEIPVKYAEFVKSIIEFDTRAVQVILSGKGLDPSISNVSKDGVFSGSGSEAYYNFLIYMLSLTFAEEFCTADINTALWLNFPELKRNRVKLGFYRHVPAKQEETAPKQRMTAVANQ